MAAELPSELVELISSKYYKDLHIYSFSPHLQIKFIAASSSSPSSSSSKWSELPSDLVDLISSKYIKDIADFARFRSVCTSWRRRSSNFKPQSKSTCKWLFLHYNLHDSFRSFVDPNTRAVYNLDLPEARDHAICASTSTGWLVMVHVQTLKVSLLNPLTRALVQLRAPPLPRTMFDPKLPQFWRFRFRCYAQLIEFEDSDCHRRRRCVLLAFFNRGSTKFVYCRWSGHDNDDDDDDDWTVVDTGLVPICSHAYRHKNNNYKKSVRVHSAGDSCIVRFGGSSSWAIPKFMTGILVHRDQQDLLLVEYSTTKDTKLDADDDIRAKYSFGFLQVEDVVRLSATYWHPLKKKKSEHPKDVLLTVVAAAGHDAAASSSSGVRPNLRCFWFLDKEGGDASNCSFDYLISGGASHGFLPESRKHTYSESLLNPLWITPSLC